MSTEILCENYHKMIANAKQSRSIPEISLQFIFIPNQVESTALPFSILVKKKSSKMMNAEKMSRIRLSDSLHPMINTQDLNDIVYRLARHHGYREAQNRILFGAGYPSPLIYSSVRTNSIYLDTLFDWEVRQSYNSVTNLPGYPFHLAIGWPPYEAHFSPAYPHVAHMPVEITFIYHTLQLLASGGLLIMLATNAQNDWPQRELGKLARKIDEYILPPIFGQPVQHCLTVFRRKPTDAVRYEN